MATGEIGTLNQDGKQVGGFFDWIISDSLTEPHFKAKIEALAFWLIEDVNPGQFDASFYQLQRGQLVLMQQEKVKVDFPGCVTDKLIRHKITMAFV